MARASDHGSSGDRPKSCDCAARPTAYAPGRPTAMPMRGQQHDVAQHQAEHVGPRRAERDADADLARAPGHRVAHQPVEPDRRQRRRQRAEHASTAAPASARPPATRRPSPPSSSCRNTGKVRSARCTASRAIAGMRRGRRRRRPQVDGHLAQLVRLLVRRVDHARHPLSARAGRLRRASPPHPGRTCEYCVSLTTPTISMRAGSFCALKPNAPPDRIVAAEVVAGEGLVDDGHLGRAHERRDR